MLQRPRATGEVGPTRDEWLRAAAAYSKRVQATVRTRKAAAAAALPADKNATSPREAEPFVPQVLVAAPCSYGAGRSCIEYTAHIHKSQRSTLAVADVLCLAACPTCETRLVD